MKSILRLALLTLIIFFIVTSWTACSSDGYEGGTTTVYVGHGYGGYGPGWGYGWGGYGGGYGGYYGPGW